jgi:prepilin-type N-terminal cleavage/methylation domain-containing protein
MTLHSERSRRRGFTIIEAMIAMAILAMVLGTAMGGVGFTVGQVAKRTDAAWATELARSVIDEYVVTRDAALKEGAVGDWRWQLTEAAAGGGLAEVTAVAWRGDDRARAVSLSVLVPEVRP